MKLFSRLIVDLDQTNKTNEKVRVLADYFKVARDDDKLWALAILSGRRPKRSVTATKLWEWANEKTSIPDWLFEESYHVVGDLAETIALLLADGIETDNRSLTYYMNAIIGLQKADDDSRKKFIQECWTNFGYYEKFVFNKLLTGNFRIGVSQKLVVKALSNIYQRDENEVTHRLMGNWTPQETSFDELIVSDSDQNFSRPYPFHLAYGLETSPDLLGRTEDWIAEWKWDGIRGQIIKRNGIHYVWSRGEDLITEKFPEFKSLSEMLEDGIVLDGEIIPMMNGKPMPFGLLQTRIGRKKIREKHLKDVPISLLVYDIIEYQGEDIRRWPLYKRKELLKKVVAAANHPRLVVSQSIDFSSWNELAVQRELSRDNNSEGIMLKAKNSVYETGRKKGSWWKWKIDPLSVDAVLLYAQKGHGRRANLYTDYTFAVWNDGKLIPFAKAYSGLTDKEILRVDSFVKRNTKEKFGPVRSVKPELVFEIGFEGINKSPRHKSGIALRFPRILKWRHDKSPEEADTLDHLKSLLEKYGT